MIDRGPSLFSETEARERDGAAHLRDLSAGYGMT
jgi:hypothetical protein